jgi:zinc transport system ATP-binding protein
MSITTDHPPIEVKEVTYRYGGLKALDSVSVNIQEGEYVAMIGPNGAGKSTLLKLILGLLTPQTGTVSIYGHSINEFEEKYLLGYVPQRVSANTLRFPATVKEVVESGRTARRGWFKGLSHTDQQKIQWAMQTAGIEKLANSSINELSGGQLQRVYIARALSGEPKILILDEPTAGVDVQTQEKFYDFLNRLNTELKLTILLVTHEVDVAVHRAKSVICLNRKLICHIPSTQLLKGKYLQELYGTHAHVVPHEHHGH